MYVCVNWERQRDDGTIINSSRTKTGDFGPPVYPISVTIGFVEGQMKWYAVRVEKIK